MDLVLKRPKADASVRQWYLQRYRQQAEGSGFNVELIEKPKLQLDVDDAGAGIMTVAGVFDDWFGIDVREVASEIESKKPKKLLIIYDSPGGVATDGLALYTSLMRYQQDDEARGGWGMQLNTENGGLVASAATLPFLAGDDRYMPDSSLFMVHPPWGWLFAMGDEQDMTKAYNENMSALKAIRQRTESIYARRTDQSLSEVEEMLLQGDTWMSPTEAVKLGYATRGEDDEDEKMKVTPPAPPVPANSTTLKPWLNSARDHYEHLQTSILATQTPL